jgi:CRP/FNR family transcriptional regulator
MTAANEQISDLKEFLGNTQMFRSLPLDQLESLAKIAQLKTYRKGETIFWEGDEGTGFFVVKTGRVKVFKLSADGKEQILHLFAVGEHFAEVPAFDGQCFPASAAAVEKSELLFFEQTAFLDLLRQEPTLAINMLVSFARHLRRFANLVENLSLKEVPGRLATYLLDLSDRTGNSQIVELDLTKSQLAARLGTIPETLSRVFYKLSSEGLIALDGAKITILDRDRLSEQASISTTGRRS